MRTALALRRIARRACIIAWLAGTVVAHAQYATPEMRSTGGPCDTGEGWSYSSACCCSTGACAPVPAHAVRAIPGGFAIMLPPGMHPKAPEGFSGSVTEAQTARSPDERAHVCIWNGRVTCALVPAQGW